MRRSSRRVDLQFAGSVAIVANLTGYAATLLAGHARRDRDKYRVRRVRRQVLAKGLDSRVDQICLPVSLVVRRIRRDFRCLPEKEEPCHE